MSVKTSETSLYYQNVRGLRTKTNTLFQNSTSMQHCDIFALTETWLQNDINNEELFDCNSFDVFRRDRNTVAAHAVRGGGVLLAVRKELSAIPVDTQDLFRDVPHIDIVGVKIRDKHKILFIFVLYIPPACPNENYEMLFDNFISFNSIYESNLIIIGDFNIPNYLYSLDNNIQCSYVSTVANFCNFFNLSQYNYIPNVNNRILDFALSNIPCRITNALDILIPEDVHHPALNIDLQHSSTRPQSFPIANNNEFNFRKANFPLLYETLQNTEWTFLDFIDDPNLAALKLNEKLYNIFSICMPRKQKCLGSYPPWYNKEIIKKIKLKEKLHRKYLKKMVVKRIF